MMKNSDEKVVSGVLIGGIVGIGAITVFLMLRKREASLEHIGEMISNVGEILENHQGNESTSIKNFGKNLHQEDTVEAVVGWITTGINLWKKFKN